MELQINTCANYTKLSHQNVTETEKSNKENLRHVGVELTPHLSGEKDGITDNTPMM